MRQQQLQIQTVLEYPTKNWEAKSKSWPFYVEIRDNIWDQFVIALCNLSTHNERISKHTQQIYLFDLIKLKSFVQKDEEYANDKWL